MNSLAALFSFQGTDRPKATRRSPGELPFRDGLATLWNPGAAVNENLRQRAVRSAPSRLRRRFFRRRGVLRAPDSL